MPISKQALVDGEVTPLKAELHDSPEMAVHLFLTFGTSSESWLNQQAQYDLWEAEKKRKSLKVRRLSAA